MCRLLVRRDGKRTAVGRTGEPQKAQLVPQGVRNRVTSVLETPDILLEGFEQHSTGGQLPRPSAQVSLLRKGCARRQDRVSQSRRCDVCPWAEPLPGRNVHRELLRHVATSQPEGSLPVWRRPLRGVSSRLRIDPDEICQQRKYGPSRSREPE